MGPNDSVDRQAVLRTVHADAVAVARSLAPDNTAEMDTQVHGETVVTTISRATTSGLRATVDDYVTNLQVAAEVQTEERTPTDINTNSNE
jgi:tRNA threonylcarbamoyladenosine modification (KEOPS) complex  Pcc1 subunit